MVLNWMKVFPFIDDMVLRQDTSNCLCASISLQSCFKSLIKFANDWWLVDSCLKFVKGLLVYISACEENIFFQFDKRVWLSTVVNDKLTVIVSIA